MACINRCSLILLVICASIFLADCINPNVELAVLPSGRNVAIYSNITEPGGDLASATVYVIDAKTHDVLWLERRIAEGPEAHLSFIWPNQMWRVSNGTNFVEPVLVAKTVDIPASEAPLLDLSAPCLLMLAPDAKDVTELAFFGVNGDLNSLTDLAGRSYYNSMDLMKVASPKTPYGRYVMENVTLIVGKTTLRFFHRNIDIGLMAFPPMVLSRSPIQHYTLTLEKIDASSRSVIFEVDAEDSLGRMQRKFWNQSISKIS